MLPQTQERAPTLFDSDPAYNDLATVFLPTRGVATRAHDLAAMPVRDRASRGAVVGVFALVAMLAGLAGLAASRYLVLPVPASSTPARIVARAQPATASKPARAAVADAPAPIQLALSRPPSLPPIAPRTIPRVPRSASPPPAPVAASAEASRWRRTPHLTGAALARALAQDVIDTRTLNMGVIRDLPASTPTTAPRPR